MENICTDAHYNLKMALEKSKNVLVEKPKTMSLEELKKVLSYISKHWPDVKFITSEELLKICK